MGILLVCLMLVVPFVSATDGPIVGGYCTDEPECYATTNPGPVGASFYVNNSTVHWEVVVNES